MSLLPAIPSSLGESSAAALDWPRLRAHIAAGASSPLGRAWTLALDPTSDLTWIDQQQQRTAEIRAFLTGGGSFDFNGLFDPTTLLDKARIDGAALEALEILSLLNITEHVAAWRNLFATSEATRANGLASATSIAALTAPLLDYDLAPLLRALRGKIEPDGSLSDDASPELRRIRRAMERQHRAIEESLRRSLRSLAQDGSTQDELITIRGDRFVIPVKAEFRRRVPGVIHGASSSGQTVFVEPLETIEQNNELVRLLDEEQSEIHRILVAMTRALGQNAPALHLGQDGSAQGEGVGVFRDGAGERDQNAVDFGLLFVEQADEFVVLLDGFHRLDEDGLAGRRRPVDNAGDLALELGLDRDDEALAADGDDVLLS